MSTAVNPIAESTGPAINQLPGNNILERAVCITIQLGTLGNRKKVSTSMIDVPLETAAIQQIDSIEIDGQPVEVEYTTTPRPAPAVDKRMLGVSKMLLDSPELKRVRKHDGRIRQYVYEKCLPYQVGIHLLPMELVTKVEEQLKVFAEEREVLVNAFLAAYPAQIEAAGRRLLVLFNVSDYKPLDLVRQAFQFEWAYLSFATPGKLRDISPALFAAEQEKAARKWTEASETIQQVLRAQMRELVDKLRDKLSPSLDSKPKQVRASNVNNLREFLEDFNIRNVTSDAQLTALVERARALLGNVAADDLRSDERLRTDLAEGFTALKSELDNIVVEGAVRSISFEDGE